MTYIGVETVNYQSEDRSWLWGPHGTEPGATLGVVLDVSAFTEATHYPNGYLLSGLLVGEITAATSDDVPVVGPYDGAAVDGRETAVGILFSSVKVPDLSDLTKDPGGAILVHGFVRASKLPVPAQVDAGAIADLGLIHFSHVA